MGLTAEDRARKPKHRRSGLNCRTWPMAVTVAVIPVAVVTKRSADGSEFQLLICLQVVDWKGSIRSRRGLALSLLFLAATPCMGLITQRSKDRNLPLLHFVRDSKHESRSCIVVSDRDDDDESRSSLFLIPPFSRRMNAFVSLPSKSISITSPGKAQQLST